MKKSLWVVGSTFVVASAVYLLTVFEWRGVGAILGAVDLVWLVGMGGATVLVFLHLRALRWRLLLRQSGVSPPYGAVYLATAVAASLTIITPLQSGELTKVEMLRRTHGVDRSAGYGTVVVERALDLGCIMVLTVVGVLAHVDLIPNRGRLLLICLLAMGFLAAALVAVMRFRLPGPLRGFQDVIRRSLAAPGMFLLASVATLLGWLTVAAGWYAALRSIGVDLGAVPTLFLTAVVTVINLASLVPGAIGVSEASTAFLLRSLETPAPAASAGALVIRAYGILVLAISQLHLIPWGVYLRRQQR